jgi:hypothetical protein
MEVVELNKLSFELLEILLVVRVIEDNNIVYVEEENNPIVYLEA